MGTVPEIFVLLHNLPEGRGIVFQYCLTHLCFFSSSSEIYDFISADEPDELAAEFNFESL